MNNKIYQKYIELINTDITNAREELSKVELELNNAINKKDHTLNDLNIEGNNLEDIWWKQ